jgi:myxalamid-type polyketide synthase MxaC
MEPIAIIGMGCRFPNASNLDAFWDLLCAGGDAIVAIPPERWDLQALYDPDPATPGKMHTCNGGFLERIDLFDAQFFGISPREAVKMDPQHRLLLEVAWEALEDAGQTRERLAGSGAGVFIGIGNSEYADAQLSAPDRIDAYTNTGSALCIAANRLSYLLDLRGPSVAIDTACSASLVAIHLACQSLWSGDSSPLALAGGVNLIIRPETMIGLSKLKALSPDGRCKTFSAEADGYGRGEGAGVVVLKPLARALADGDRVYATIRGSAINQDGRTNGITAPAWWAQEALLREAYRRAGVAPAAIQYVETHGTGTLLGDPIEVKALGAVLAEGRNPDDVCMIGSVKTNIGHLETAAGVASLIKTALALRYRQLPPSLHSDRLNPYIPFDRLPLRVQRSLGPWPDETRPLFAGVSSFSFGGTNAHVVLEEPPPNETVAEPDLSGRAVLLPISAQSPRALQELVHSYRTLLADSNASPLHDLCFSAGTRRSHHDHRLAVAARSREELVDHLDAFLAGDEHPAVALGHVPGGRVPRLAFVFVGQGSQWPGMGRQLLAEEPVFREQVERCDALFRQHAGWSLLDELGADDARLDHTAVVQPLIFALQIGLAALWRSWGIVPDAVVGHSVGEVAAAHVAGALSLEQAVNLIFHRSRVMEPAHGRGAMASVELPAAELEPLLAGYGECLNIAGLNSPTTTVVSGTPEAIDDLLRMCGQRGIFCRRLDVSYAYHSAQMDAPGADLARAIGSLEPQPNDIMLVSTVTGASISGDELGPAYWVRNLREPVRFAAAVEALADEGCTVFVEVGPHPVLGRSVTQCLEHCGRTGLVLPSLRRRQDERLVLLGSLGGLYAAGCRVAWENLYSRGGSFCHLPLYPWQRSRFWLEGDTLAAAPHYAFRTTEREPAWAELLYEQTWRARARDAAPLPTAVPATWLLLADPAGVAAALARRLTAHGATPLLISPGPALARLAPDRFQLDPACAEDFARLLALLADAGLPPCHGIVHLWSLPDPAAPLAPVTAHGLLAAQTLGSASIPPLVRALAPLARPPRLWLVTLGVQPVGRAPGLRALAQAPLWGLGRVLALELPAAWGGLLDLDPAATAEAAAAALLPELLAPDGEDLLAFAGGERFGLRLVRRQAAPVAPLRLRAEGSYLVTGGLGSLGLRVAGWLAEHGARRLVLVGRRGLAGLAAEERAALAALEAQGVAVEVAALDVCDEAGLRALLERLQQGPQRLRGIVHAAGVVERVKLVELQAEQLEAALGPKLVGGWLLHSLSEELGLELDLLVGFSSAAAVWGSRELGHYAAANQGLDSVLEYRRGRGLPALSVNWGPWLGGGMLGAREAAELERLGVAGLRTEEGLGALEALLTSGGAQATVARVRWERFVGVYEARGRRALLEELRGEAEGAARGQGEGELRAALAGLAAGERWGRLVAHLQAEVARVLGLDPAHPPHPQQGFFQLGMDSLMAVELRARLQVQLGVTLPATVAFDYSTVEALAGYLASEHLALDQPGKFALAPAAPAISVTESEPVAIIGMGCRFPGGADDPERFWRQLVEGVDAIREVPPERWDIEQYYDPDPEAAGKMYTRWGGFLERVDQFDAAFFGIAPREAVSMDPQQRLLLEVAWEALEHAGLAPDRLRGSRTGVFVGITNSDYLQLQVKLDDATRITAYTAMGSALNFAAGRLSYLLGLHGPSLAVDTACSSSLVALHLACQSLRQGECDLALAGGVSLILAPEANINLCKARMLSYDGRCKTFDARADGYVRGEGCGVVVLKRVSAALAAGDRVLAVVRGSAVNQDGPSSGLTVPNGLAQRTLLREALGRAGVAPAQVQYVEAHGTGTALGDPIEVAALTSVLGEGRTAAQPLVLGSVKTNIGHLEAAAGIAGVIKTVLALQHGQIPPNLHFTQLNPHIALGAVPVEIATALRPWPAGGERRIAGVSSFGVSGTNAHVVLEEAPGRERVASPVERPLHLLCLSAQSQIALQTLIERYQILLSDSPEMSVADVCFTAGYGRAHYAHRFAVTASSAAQLGERLAMLQAGDVVASAQWGELKGAQPPRIVFLFTGQGAQYAGMGRELFETQPTFRAALARCDELLRPYLKRPLLSVLYPEPGERSPIDETAYTQPALFALEYALAELWRSWGVEPAFVTGHSVGEYTAACVAGVFSLEHGIRLIAERGRLMQALPQDGAMCSVLADEMTVAAAIAEHGGAVAIAAINGPTSTVISGAVDRVHAVRNALEGRGLKTKLLSVSHAFHSPLMEPMLAAFEEVASTVSWSPPRICLVSNLTGRPAEPESIGSVAYWRRHVREPVRFAAGIEWLRTQGDLLFVEIGAPPNPAWAGGRNDRRR